MLRSNVSTISGMPLGGPFIETLNASQAILYFGANANTRGCEAMVDIICEVTHSIVS